MNDELQLELGEIKGSSELLKSISDILDGMRQLNEIDKQQQQQIRLLREILDHYEAIIKIHERRIQALESR